MPSRGRSSALGFGSWSADGVRLRRSDQAMARAWKWTGVNAAGLRHVTGDALDYALFAAAQLDDVAIGVAHKHRDLPAFAEADRSLGDRNVVFLQRSDCCRDGWDAQRDVSVAGEFVRDVHQNIGGRIAGIGVEY